MYERAHRYRRGLGVLAGLGDDMPTEWLLKLSGHEDDLRELHENFSFPECCIVVEDGNFYLKSIRLNSCSEEKDVLKEAEALVQMINGLSKLQLSNWWEIKIATGPEHEHRRMFVER
jgi:hypothetical protein